MPNAPFWHIPTPWPQPRPRKTNSFSSPVPSTRVTENSISGISTAWRTSKRWNVASARSVWTRISIARPVGLRCVTAISRTSFPATRPLIRRASSRAPTAPHPLRPRRLALVGRTVRVELDPEREQAAAVLEPPHAIAGAQPKPRRRKERLADPPRERHLRIHRQTDPALGRLDPEVRALAREKAAGALRHAERAERDREREPAVLLLRELAVRRRERVARRSGSAAGTRRPPEARR